MFVLVVCVLLFVSTFIVSFGVFRIVWLALPVRCWDWLCWRSGCLLVVVVRVVALVVTMLSVFDIVCCCCCRLCVVGVGVVVFVVLVVCVCVV